MTDNEIIKALECCKQGECDTCPFYGKKEDCEVELPEEALDLINRQRAEIEEKNIKIEFLQSSKDLNQAEFDEVKAELELKKAEIECLQNELSVVKYKNSYLQSTYQELKIYLESMRSAANSYKLHYEESQAEIERLKKTVVDLNANITDLIFQKDKAESEAIKKFENRLYSYLGVWHLRPPTEVCFSEIAVKQMIERVVKEMEKQNE